MTYFGHPLKTYAILIINSPKNAIIQENKKSKSKHSHLRNFSILKICQEIKTSSASMFKPLRWHHHFSVSDFLWDKMEEDTGNAFTCLDWRSLNVDFWAICDDKAMVSNNFVGKISDESYKLEANLKYLSCFRGREKNLSNDCIAATTFRWNAPIF